MVEANTFLGLVEDVLLYMMKQFGDPLLRRMLSMTCHSMRKHFELLGVSREVLEMDILRHGTLAFIQKYATPSVSMESYCCYGKGAIQIGIDRNYIPLVQWGATLSSHHIDNHMYETVALAGRLEMLQWICATYGERYVSIGCFHHACRNDDLPMAQWLYEIICDQRYNHPAGTWGNALRMIASGCVTVFQWLYSRNETFRAFADSILADDEAGTTGGVLVIRQCWSKLQEQRETFTKE